MLLFGSSSIHSLSLGCNLFAPLFQSLIYVNFFFSDHVSFGFILLLNGKLGGGFKLHCKQALIPDLFCFKLRIFNPLLFLLHFETLDL
jgi:hypothetical protein